MTTCKQQSEISASKKRASEVGWCNGCTKGSSDYINVTEFTLRGWSARVCEDCKDDLIAKLKAAR